MDNRQVFLVTEDELTKRFKDMENSIVERLRPQLSVVEEPVSHKEAAAYLGINRHTLTERLKNGTYPATIIHVNGARKVYFKSELKGILK